MVRAGLATAVLAGTLLTACGAPSEQITSASTTTRPAGEGWERLPPAPLSPRGGAVLVPLEDGQLLVAGGDTAPGCHDTFDMSDSQPPETSESRASSRPAVISASTADCAGPETETRLRDGAILERSGQWTTIADAPAPMSAPTRGIVVGDVVYFWALPIHLQGELQGGVWMSYDVPADTWTRLEDPPVEGRPHIGVVRAGDRVVAYQTSDENGETADLIYDTKADDWSELPDDPLATSFDRRMIWTGSGVGLVARDHSSLGNPSGPALRGAVFDLARGEWRSLADGDVSHSNETWEWALSRVVNAAAAGEDPALGSALPPAPSLAASCDDVHPPADGSDGESGLGDLRLGDWTLNVPAETNGTTSCNENLPQFATASAWAFDGVVVFGGYETVAKPGEFPTDYEFSNDAWIWRPD